MDIEQAESVRASATALYGLGQRIWDEADLWNQYKRHQISKFVEANAAALLAKANTVLNAGSGGEPYAWLPRQAINADIFLAQARKLPNPLVCDVSSLPFPKEVFDMVICVGPVLNYAAVVETVCELGRVTKIGGHVVLHYESSRSFEHLLRKPWNRFVAPVETVNSGHTDRLWVYSPKLVDELLKQNGLVIRRATSFHIISSAVMRLGLPQPTAARFAKFDRQFRWLRFFADDQIILAEKTATTNPAN